MSPSGLTHFLVFVMTILRFWDEMDKLRPMISLSLCISCQQSSCNVQVGEIQTRLESNFCPQSTQKMKTNVEPKFYARADFPHCRSFSPSLSPLFFLQIDCHSASSREALSVRQKVQPVLVYALFRLEFVKMLASSPRSPDCCMFYASARGPIRFEDFYLDLHAENAPRRNVQVSFHIFQNIHA